MADKEKRNYSKEYAKAMENKVNVGLRIDKDIYTKFKEKLAKEGKSINQALTEFITYY